MVHEIVNSAPVLHASFMPTRADDDPFPTILPMLGCFGSYNAPGAIEASPPTVYLHGHISSRFFKISSSSGKTPWEEDGLPGLPICVCATHMDGLILALTPFNHSTNYRSAVVHGYATLVTDPKEKDFALTLITDNILRDRWANSRVPPTEAEMKATGVIRMDVVDASAKVRAYTVGNEKFDIEDPEVSGRVWTGVIPSYVKYDEPIPARENLVKEVPAYITKWIDENNKKGEEYARAVAVKPKGSS